MTRILAFLVVVISAYFLPFPVFVAAVLVYVSLWPGYELLIPAAFVDMQFGLGGSLLGLWYTSTAGVVIIAGLVIKPTVRFYK